MSTNVVMEALSPTMEEGRLVEWKKQEGEAVAVGDVLAEVETDKAVMELVARAGGTLIKQVVPAGTTVPVSELVAVIAYSFWERQFAGDTSAVGQTLRIDGVPFTIVGVTPRGFSGMQATVAAEITIPLGGLEHLAGRTPSRDRPPQASHVLARLKPDMSLEAARAHVNTLWPDVQAATLPPNLTPEARADTLQLRPLVESAGRGFSSLRATASATCSSSSRLKLVTVSMVPVPRNLPVKTQFTAALRPARLAVIRSSVTISLALAISATGRRASLPFSSSRSSRSLPSRPPMRP